MAPEQAEGRRGGRRGRRLLARPRRSTRRSRASTRCAARGAGGDRAAARRAAAAARPRCGATCRRSSCAAIDRARRARSPERARHARRPARRAARPRSPAVDDERGHDRRQARSSAPAPRPARARRARRGPSARRRGADRRRWPPAALAWLTPARPAPPVSPPPARGVAARRWRCCCRVAWLGWPLARRALAGLAGRSARRRAVAGRRSPRARPCSCRAPARLWSLPAAAPLLGLAALAGACPALAGQAARPLASRRARRAAAPGGSRSPRPLTGAAAARARPRPARALGGSARSAAARRDAAAALAARGRCWARRRASLLPRLVRGRWLAVDLVGARRWAAGLAAATQAVGRRSSRPRAMRGARGRRRRAGAPARVAAAASRARGGRRSRLRSIAGSRAAADALACPSGSVLDRMSVLRNLEEQDRRPRRGRVRPRLPHPRSARSSSRASSRKEMEEHKTVSVSRMYVPNEYVVFLSPEDRERFEGYEHALRDELSAYLLEHARRERLALRQPPADRVPTPTTACASASSASRRGSCGRPTRGRGRGPSRPTTATRWSTRPTRRAPGRLEDARRRRRRGRAVVRRRGQALRRRPRRRDDRPQPRLRHRARRRQRLAPPRRDLRPRGRRLDRQRPRLHQRRAGQRAQRVDGPQPLQAGDRIELGHRRRCASRWSEAAMLEPVSVALKFGFLAVLYLFLLWVARSALKDLRARRTTQRRPPPDAAAGRDRHALRRVAAAPAPPAASTRGWSSSARRGSSPGTEYDVGEGAIARARRRGRDPRSRTRSRPRATRASSRQGGVVVLEDLGSTNGTYLNGELLAGPQPLHPGDRVRIGDSEFTLPGPLTVLRVADHVAPHRHRPPAPRQRGRASSRARRCSRSPTAWAARRPARSPRRSAVEAFERGPARRRRLGRGAPGRARARGQRADPRARRSPTTQRAGMGTTLTAAYVGERRRRGRARRRQPRSTACATASSSAHRRPLAGRGARCAAGKLTRRGGRGAPAALDHHARAGPEPRRRGRHAAPARRAPATSSCSAATA